MNGAESLARTLTGAGVEVCFANPGTSEMHFVAALDRVEGLRCVLGLFEGVVTGAADGYARMAEKPASTLLHLGPGLANGLANIHNARRANTPMVNIVGDHATYHKEYDAPLTSDVEGVARPFSHWVRTSADSRSVARDGAAAAATAYIGALDGPAILDEPRLHKTLASITAAGGAGLRPCSLSSGSNVRDARLNAMNVATRHSTT